MSTLEFSIKRWSAWVPQAEKAALCYRYANGDCRISKEEKPDLSLVPAMQRRRLGPLARVVFASLYHCTGEERSGPVVFCSTMGEIQRTQSILENIAREQPVSPAAFSLSVHNAIAGQWSLINGNTSPMVALASVGGSPVPAILEGMGMLSESSCSSVDIVLYEEKRPEFYSPFLSGPDAPMAIALRLSILEEGTEGIHLSLHPTAIQPDTLVIDELDHMNELLILLRNHSNRCESVLDGSKWSLESHHG